MKRLIALFTLLLVFATTNAYSTVWADIGIGKSPNIKTSPNIENSFIIGSSIAFGKKDGYIRVGFSLEYSRNEHESQYEKKTYQSIAYGLFGSANILKHNKIEIDIRAGLEQSNFLNSSDISDYSGTIIAFGIPLKYSVAKNTNIIVFPRYKSSLSNKYSEFGIIAGIQFEF